MFSIFTVWLTGYFKYSRVIALLPPLWECVIYLCHCCCYQTTACTNCSNGGKSCRERTRQRKSLKKRLSQAEWPGILSLGVSMGSQQCVLIHPSQRALEQGFPKPANSLTWYSEADSPVFVLWNEQWNNKQIQAKGVVLLQRGDFDWNSSCTLVSLHVFGLQHFLAYIHYG